MTPDAAISAAIEWLSTHPRITTAILVVVTLAALSFEVPA